MNFITIEHIDGSITVPLNDVDYGCYRRKPDKYYIVFRSMLKDLELTKEQYDNLIKRLTY